MRKLLLLIISIGMYGCQDVTNIKGTESPHKMNIIMFLVDDMGWQDSSEPMWTQETDLNRKFHTPNMERLADQGMKFTQAYACAICSPTRVSLITGMNAARHRVTNWTLHKNKTTDSKDDVLNFPEWNMNGLQTIDSIEHTVYATTLPQILREHGYFTIHSGKAHFGAINSPGENPLNLGFDINIAGHAAGAPSSYQGLNNYGNDENGQAINVWSVPGLEKYYGQDINLSDALTKEAISALDSAQELDKPFYLYMAHYAVHTPIQADHRYVKKYYKTGMDSTEAKYASMVEGMDKSLGDLMDYLEEKDLTQNTIIVFMSDNGGLSAVGRGGIPNTHNLPLNSGKGSAYEGGIREPMIVKWPKVSQANSVCDDYLIIEDFFPTILEMAEIKDYKTVQTVDGESFVHLIKQDTNSIAHNDLIWHFPNKWGANGPGIGTYSSIRSGDWKLIYYYKDQHFELYNIINDIGEKENLTNMNIKKTKELAVKLSDYLRRVEAQRPTIKKTNELVPWPDEVF